MNSVAVIEPRSPVPKDLEPVLVDIDCYLIGVPNYGKDRVARAALRRHARDYMQWNKRLFRPTAKDPRLIPIRADRPQNLRSYHNEIRHWGPTTTKKFIFSRLWWPYMHGEINSYVRSCVGWQCATPITRYRASP